jgi:hypothetical protein
MSVEHPVSADSEYRSSQTDTSQDITAVAARVEEWLGGAAQPHTQPEARDPAPRKRDVLNPSATRIGQPTRPDEEFTDRGCPEPETDDIGERLRRLHAERDARLQGNEARRDQLDIARITQALCNTLDLTPWERDRVLGVVCELDRSAFGDRHTIPRVVLVVARRVVDAERRAWLGLDAATGDEPPRRIRELADRLTRLTDSPQYTRLLSECDLSPAAADAIETALDRELDEETIQEVAFGRSPNRDPALPAFESYAPERDT